MLTIFEGRQFRRAGLLRKNWLRFGGSPDVRWLGCLNVTTIFHQFGRRTYRSCKMRNIVFIINLQLKKHKPPTSGLCSGKKTYREFCLLFVLRLFSWVLSQNILGVTTSVAYWTSFKRLSKRATKKTSFSWKETVTLHLPFQNKPGFPYKEAPAPMIVYFLPKMISRILIISTAVWLNFSKFFQKNAF